MKFKLKIKSKLKLYAAISIVLITLSVLIAKEVTKYLVVLAVFSLIFFVFKKLTKR